MTPSQRLRRAIKYTRLNTLEFSKSLGYTNNGQIGSILAGTYGISPAVARRIVDVYPDISYEWLTEGLGNFYALRPTDPLHHRIKKLEAEVDELKKLVATIPKVLVG